MPIFSLRYASSPLISRQRTIKLWTKSRWITSAYLALVAETTTNCGWSPRNWMSIICICGTETTRVNKWIGDRLCRGKGGWMKTVFYAFVGRLSDITVLFLHVFSWWRRSAYLVLQWRCKWFFWIHDIALSFFSRSLDTITRWNHTFCRRFWLVPARKMLLVKWFISFHLTVISVYVMIVPMVGRRLPFIIVVCRVVYCTATFRFHSRVQSKGNQRLVENGLCTIVAQKLDAEVNGKLGENFSCIGKK